VVAFPSEVSLEVRILAEVTSCLVCPAPVVHIPIHLTSLRCGFPLEAAVGSVSTQGYLSVSICSPYVRGGFISNLADGDLSYHCE